VIDVTRRTAVGGLLIGSFAPGACSGAASSAKPGGRGNGLRPGRNWNGTAGSGGTAPAQSEVPRGTLVPDERFIGGFSAAPGQWIHGEGIRITALGLPPQSADSSEINYFKEAVFYLEGNTVTVTDWSVNQTPVRMYDGRMAPQGSIGFSVEIGAGEGPVTAGDAILYCYLRGEHGLERRIALPLVINVDRSLDAKRKTGYVDPVAGDDSAAGTQAAPWKTIARGLSNRGVGDGGLLILARAGRYVEDRNGGPGLGMIDNARVIEVKPADGLRPDQVVITRTDRYLPAPRWGILARRVHFHGVTVDMSKFPRIMGAPGTQVGFFGCQLLDRERMYGERNAAGRSMGLNFYKGDPQHRDILPPLPYLGGHGFYLLETLFEGAAPMAPRLYRNVTAKLTTDSFQGGPGYDDVVIDGYDAVIGEPAPIRLHQTEALTVESVAREGQGNTAITLRDVGDMSPMKRIWDLQVRILSGAGAGPTPHQLVLADPATRRVVVEGDLVGTLAPGDAIMCYAIFHVDFMQQGGVQRPNQRGMRNTTVFRYHAEGPTAQLFLTQGSVPLLPNSVITTDGATFRISSPSGPNEILPDDILQLQGGAQPGEYRFVKSFDAATGSGVLLEPFSRNQSNAPVQRAKTVSDFVMALSTLRKTGHGYEMGQFQHGHRNFLLAQNTFISEPSCLTFRSKMPGHGHRNHVQLFNLCTRIDADLPELPSWGLRIEHVHLLAGKLRGKFSRLRPVSLSFGEKERYQPSREILRIGRKPLIPFDSFGNPVDADSPVGSLAV
jgi:hypothetical protein